MAEWIRTAVPHRQVYRLCYIKCGEEVMSLARAIFVFVEMSYVVEWWRRFRHGEYSRATSSRHFPARGVGLSSSDHLYSFRDGNLVWRRKCCQRRGPGVLRVPTTRQSTARVRTRAILLNVSFDYLLLCKRRRCQSARWTAVIDLVAKLMMEMDSDVGMHSENIDIDINNR